MDFDLIWGELHGFGVNYLDFGVKFLDLGVNYLNFRASCPNLG